MEELVYDLELIRIAGLRNYTYIYMAWFCSYLRVFSTIWSVLFCFVFVARVNNDGLNMDEAYIKLNYLHDCVCLNWINVNNILCWVFYVSCGHISDLLL